MSDQERCPSCGGLVAPTAEWCGQCYQSLRSTQHSSPPSPAAAEGTPQPVPTRPGSNGNGHGGKDVVRVGTPRDPLARLLSPAGVATEHAERASEERGAEGEPRRNDPAWPCPTCGIRNRLDDETCRACGTPFVRLFEEPEEDRPPVDSGKAFMLSLLLPGLGHAACRRAAEGVARAIMYLWSVAMGLLVVLAHPAGGLGPLLVAGVLFLAVAGVIYVVTAVDASRLAQGYGQFLSARHLLYGTVGLVMLSLLTFFLIVARASSALH